MYERMFAAGAALLSNPAGTASNLATIAPGPGGETGRHSGLKIRRFVHSGRAGSSPARGTKSGFAFAQVLIDRSMTWSEHSL